MARKRLDPLEPTMEEALEPGRFIPYGRSFDFVNGLESVRDSIQALVDTGERREAAPLPCLLRAGVRHGRVEHLSGAVIRGPQSRGGLVSWRKANT